MRSGIADQRIVLREDDMGIYADKPSPGASEMLDISAKGSYLGSKAGMLRFETSEEHEGKGGRGSGQV
jgi:hypothetical protein